MQQYNNQMLNTISEFVYLPRLTFQFGCHRFRYLNILTDFVDAEVFLIDGDSLLLELLGERSLDWSNGGQFLHLTYLFERFLQYFADKGQKISRVDLFFGCGTAF